MPSPALLVVRELKFNYVKGEGDVSVEAVRGVDLTVCPGEYIAIVGPNGSGKSTLAKTFNALLIPTSGSVTVNGLDTSVAANVFTIRQMVGMVFQNPDNQLVASVVEEDVAFGPENLGLDPAEISSRVIEALKLVALLDYRKRPTYALSGGEKQRLAIAGVLALNPMCLVLDEPTSMLDPEGRREVLGAISSLSRKHEIAVIHITQHMSEAALADRVLVMNEGKVILEGSPREIFKEVQTLTQIGLEVPLITRLGKRLAARGLNIPDPVLTVEEMVAALCQLT